MAISRTIDRSFFIFPLFGPERSIRELSSEDNHWKNEETRLQGVWRKRDALQRTYHEKNGRNAIIYL